MGNGERLATERQRSVSPPPSGQPDAKAKSDAAIPAARGADAAVLVVRIGHARIEEARRTLECVGAGNFIGSVAVSA